MSVAEKLERLARVVPGVGGYQDKETSRDTDKALRLRLVEELGKIKRSLEGDKRKLMEMKDLSLLPLLDGVASKLDKIGNLIQYAGRGYHGVFDAYKLNQKKLDQLYTFDLELFDKLDSIKTGARRVRESRGDSAALKSAADHLHESLDGLEALFATRSDILTAE